MVVGGVMRKDKPGDLVGHASAVHLATRSDVLAVLRAATLTKAGN